MWSLVSLSAFLFLNFTFLFFSFYSSVIAEKNRLTYKTNSLHHTSHTSSMEAYMSQVQGVTSSFLRKLWTILQKLDPIFWLRMQLLTQVKDTKGPLLDPCGLPTGQTCQRMMLSAWECVTSFNAWTAQGRAFSSLFNTVVPEFLWIHLTLLPRPASACQRIKYFLNGRKEKMESLSLKPELGDAHTDEGRIIHLYAFQARNVSNIVYK